MIIICPCGKKKFDVDSNLIPEQGKLLQCGSCDQTWFFNKENHIDIDEEIIPKKSIIIDDKRTSSKPKEKKETLNENVSNPSYNSGSELVKYEAKFNFTFGKILNYLIVLIISFVAVIIILDTFKGLLTVFFPNIELILYNLFETLKDLILFIKDLK